MLLQVSFIQCIMHRTDSFYEHYIDINVCYYVLFVLLFGIHHIATVLDFWISPWSDVLRFASSARFYSLLLRHVTLHLWRQLCVSLSFPSVKSISTAFLKPLPLLSSYLRTFQLLRTIFFVYLLYSGEFLNLYFLLSLLWINLYKHLSKHYLDNVLLCRLELSFSFHVLFLNTRNIFLSSQGMHYCRQSVNFKLWSTFLDSGFSLFYHSLA